jgi:ribosomal protein S18 acetylase RimI-like enzyme
VTIRPLEPADIDAVVELALRAWAPVFDSTLAILGPDLFRRSYGDDWRAHQGADVRRSCETHEAWVATLEDGTVAGYVTIALRREEGVGEVYMIAVDPDAQRQGIGLALTYHALDRMREEGMGMVEIGTGGDPGHAAARGLYEKAGLIGFPSVHYSMLLS